MKIYVKDEDQILQEFCESKNCTGEEPTESDPTGCTGCDAQEEYMEKNFNRVVSESDKNTFIAVDDLINELNLSKEKCVISQIRELKSELDLRRELPEYDE